MLKATQLSLPLHHANFLSLRYLVPHSGILSAVRLIEEAVLECVKAPESFRIVVLEGPPGSGKSHLVGAYLRWAKECGIVERSLRYVHLTVDSDETSSFFVAEFERLRASGGVLFVEVGERDKPFNPHIESRLRSALRCRLEYPQGEELRPLVESLLERHHLRLPGESVEFLLERLPRTPLSLENIIAAISEESFGAQRSPKKNLLREVLRVRGDL